MTLRASLLLVDDQPENFDVVQVLLHGEGYELNYAASGQRALDRLGYYTPDVILLDAMMPDLDGLETCRQIKANPQWRSIPIIMVTALSSKEDLARCLEAGADDFISKPVDKVELRARVRSMVRLSTQYFEIQKLYSDLQTVNQTLSSFNEVLEAQVQQRTQALEQALHYDHLTKLPSRRLFCKIIQQAMQEERRLPFAIASLDCDQFKLINASLGHVVGDRLLRAIAHRLSGFLRENDVVARLGGDEFCFFLHEIESTDDMDVIANQILLQFQFPFVVEDLEIYLTACMGMTFFSPAHATAEEPLQEADTAMHRAKLQGKSSYQVFEAAMHQSAVGRLQLEQDMQRALKRQEFRVHYQPILDLKTEQIVGFEALVRWQHPERGMVSPAEFIPCAEETGLVVPLGMMVLWQACEQLCKWQETIHPQLSMSVNLSVRQFAHPTLLEDIDQMLAETGIAPHCLKLEITESAIMENPDVAIALTQQLRARQIQLSIDDFGTGYSSLSYLSRFPVDNIKIDRSFVNAIDTGNNAQIIEIVLSLGQALGMAIVAEGIETSRHLEYLQALGCDMGQGYYFSKPLTPEQATLYLQEHPPTRLEAPSSHDHSTR